MMYQAQIRDDTEGWNQVIMARPMSDAEMREPILWCKLHASDGKWECGFKSDIAVFRFEQLEDAVMFRLKWCRDSG